MSFINENVPLKEKMTLPEFVSAFMGIELSLAECHFFNELPGIVDKELNANQGEKGKAIRRFCRKNLPPSFIQKLVTKGLNTLPDKFHSEINPFKGIGPQDCIFLFDDILLP